MTDSLASMPAGAADISAVRRIRLDRSLLEKSRAYGYAQVIGNLGVFGALVVLASFANRWWELILLSVAIGCAQHRLFFPIHDCIHYSLFPTRRENRFFGAMVVSFLGTSFEAIRDQHLDHHRDFGTAVDPGAADYFVRFKSRRELLAFLLVPLVGGILIPKLGDYLRRPLSMRGSRQAGERKRSISVTGTLRSYGTILLAQALVFIVLTRGGQWQELWRYPLLYILPLVTVFLSLIRIRMFLEHGSLDYSVCDYLDGRRPTTRTIYGSWFERIVLCGGNFNYHHEHHLYPGVPGWQLPRLHRAHIDILDVQDVRVTYLQALIEVWKNLGPKDRRQAAD